MFSLEHSRARPRRDANESESSPEHGTPLGRNALLNCRRQGSIQDICSQSSRRETYVCRQRGKTIDP